MKKLLRYFKPISTAISIACASAVFLIIVIPNAYPSDNESLDLTVTKFLDSLSYKYNGFEFKLMELSVGEQYTDNVTYQKTKALDDFITLSKLGIGVRYEGKARSLEFRGDIVSQNYAKNSNFNNITEEFTTNFRNEFSENDRMSLKNDFLHTNQPLFWRADYFDEQFLREQVRGELKYLKNDFHIDYAKDVSKQLTLITKYDNNIYTFSGTGASGLQNSVFNNPGLEADYLISSATTALISYDFANRRFEDGENATIHTVVVGGRQYITKKLFFDGRAGFNSVESYDDKSFTKPVYHTSFGYQKDTDTFASLSFDKKDILNPYNTTIFDNWRTTLSLRKQLLERFKCSFSLFYGEGEMFPSNNKRRMTGINTTLKYDINQNLSGNFIYTYTHSNTGIETSGYTKNTIFLGLTAAF